jgi:mono/diheme cytochrome c family protein
MMLRLTATWLCLGAFLVNALAACDQDVKHSSRGEVGEEAEQSPSGKKTPKPKPSKTKQPNEGETDDGEEIEVKKPDEGLYLDFFNKNVRDAVFNQACIRCHVGPRVAANPRGPESIYVYKVMRAKLIEGDGPTTNSLIGKMVNVSKHSGGDLCPGGLTDAPCKAVLDWYEQEFGAIENRAGLTKPQPSNNRLNSITELGRVNGWAINPANISEYLKVRIYVDGNNASGKTPIEAMANVDAFDGGADGAHAFAVDLPAMYLDGKKHMAYVYMVIGANEAPVEGSPKEFTAYTQNLTTGKPFYDQNLQSAMTGSCGNCHNPTYITQWAALLSPPPSNGGTRDNNRLVLKASGGLNHRGGNLCGGGGLCDNIRLWWDREFGGAQ